MFLMHTDEKDKATIIAKNQANILLIRDLFQNILRNETNPDLLIRAIGLYSNIGTPEKAKDEVIATLQRAKDRHIPLNFITNNFNHLPSIYLSLAFMSNETQIRDLPDLLNVNNPNANIMPFYVASKLERRKPEEINDQLRPMLKDYLLQYQTEIINNKYPYIKDQQRLPLTNWLKAYATVMVKHSDEQIPYMFTYIRALSDPRLQAQYLTEQDLQTIIKLKLADRKYYQTLFQQKLQNPELSDTDRRLFKSGLGAIKNAIETSARSN